MQKRLRSATARPFEDRRAVESTTLFDGRDGSQLLYAAQVALATHKKKGSEWTPADGKRHSFDDEDDDFRPVA
ncbi:MAG TPA: hypothetical protein VK716_00600 [Terracidiphilus sp.]|jgi:hypothetical protein|nr:hypothetical protein [Terracidiphilus sp.]